jgi:lipoyl(octanoyl) transferase
MRSARLILEPVATTGAWNMAVDEALLESALAHGTATIRIYQWSAPTVSLGYFQDADEFARDRQWQGVAAVRRLSGGGAILHDRELTYSLTLPPAHPLTAQPSNLYALVHAAIIEVLAAHGITASLRGTPSVRSPWSIEDRSAGLPESMDNGQLTIDRSSFLCFGRGDPNDVLLGPHKIVGSAQRRRRGAILQHGSLLLERSPHAPDFPGIAELAGIHLDRSAFSHQFGAAIAATLGKSATLSDLAPQEHSLARSLELDRYRSIRWRSPSSPRMTIDY